MTWLKTGEIAERTHKATTTIEKSAKKNHAHIQYINGRGRGGKVMLVALETLPMRLQNQYNGVFPKQPDALSFAAKQRADAHYKAYIIESYWASCLSPAAYVSQYNQEHPGDPITADRLFRWQRKYRESGHSVSALVDRRGGHNRGKSNIHPV